MVNHHDFCYNDGGRVRLVYPLPDIKGNYDVVVPGITRIPGWSIEVTVIPRDKMPKHPGLENPSSPAACIDRDKVGDKIKVRARERGDRFQPLGMSETKKVGEFMLDAQIPRTWRDRVPVFYNPDGIIWVAGWRIDERVKITEDTREVLCLKMVRCGDEQCGESKQYR